MGFEIFLSKLSNEYAELEKEIFHTKERIQNYQKKKKEDFDMWIVYDHQEKSEKIRLEQLIQKRRVLDTIINAVKETVESLKK